MPGIKSAHAVACVILGFLSFIATSAMTGRAQAATLSIATDQEKEGGYLVDITRAAFERVGYSVKIAFVPWARALEGTMAGHYDVLMAAYFTSERAKTMAYSDQIGSVEVCLWKRSDRKITYNSLEDLKNLTIGFVRNSVVNDDFNKIMPQLNIDYANNGEINLMKLIAGNIDIVVEKRELIDVLLNKKYPADRDKVQTLGAPLMSGKYYNTFSRARPDYEKSLADFNRGLQMIRDDGTEKSILVKHGLATTS